MVALVAWGMIQNIVVTNDHVITHTYILLVIQCVIELCNTWACYSFCFACLGKFGGLIPAASKFICIKYEAVKLDTKQDD